MKPTKKLSSVAGVTAPSPRPTKLAAALVATAVSLPVLAGVIVFELLT